MPSFTPKNIKPPSADYARNYNQYGGAGFWQNINMTPDFPSAARAMLNLYEKGTGDGLDGVIVADPFSLKSMLEVTGPVTVPRFNVRVAADNVVAYTTNRAYEVFTNKDTRQIVLGEVAKAVFDEFMRHSETPGRTLRGLVDPIGSGHLLVYTKDSKMQEALLRSTKAGELRGGKGDFLSVIQNNGSATKLDFYQDRSITYSVKLGPEGTAIGTASVRLSNHAPRRGVTPYIIGPYQNVAPAGTNVSFVNLYCGSSCALRDFHRNDREQLIVAGTERGYHYFQDYLRIPSKETAKLDFDLGTRGAWEGNHAGGVYRLTFLNQTTIRPTKVRIQIQAPEGMNISFTNVPMKVSGGMAVWEGTPSARLQLEVHFQPPFFQRIWSDITDFLSKPVL